MKIIDFIRSLFTKNEKCEELINITDLLNIPAKENISDVGLLQIIDSYEKKYSEMLNKKEYQTLSYHNLEKVRKDLDEILNIIEGIVIGSNLQRTVLREDDENSILSKLKLAIYRNEVMDQERETYAKIIALQEMRNKVFISKRKRNNIQKELDYLSGVFLVLKNVRTAIDLKIDAYLREISPTKDETFDERKELARRLIIAIAPEKLAKIEELHLQDTLELATIETVLEKFAYKNKESIEQLKEELENVSSKEELQRLEIYYLLYAIYGRNLLTEHEMACFYEKRFEILTKDISNITEPFVNESTNSLEKSCYEELVSSKARKILKHKGAFESMTNSESIFNSIEKFVKKCMNLPEETLNSPIELALLLSLERGNGLREFFETYNIELNKIDDDSIKEVLSMYKGVFTWEDKVPFKTFLWLLAKDENGIEKISKENNLIATLYEIYNCLYPQSKKVYEFPEGLSTINVITINDDGEPSDDLINKDIICPSTLKSMKLDYRNINQNGNIQLNEGLEELDLKISTSIMNELVIPSSVKSLRISTPPSKIFETKKSGVKKLIFKDFQNSRFLNDEKALIKFIRENYHAKRTGKEKYHYPSEYALQKQKDYWEGRYSTFIDADLFDHPYTNIEYKIVPNDDSPQEIILIDDDGNEISLDISSLNVTFYRQDRYLLNGRDSDLWDEHIKKLIEVIKEHIKASKSIQYTKNKERGDAYV